MDSSVIANLAIVALPIVFAITLHEAAHGYVARHFGDQTAAMLGRISLNPLRHIDPVGTIAVPLLIYFSSALLGGSGIIFGWAKPVPVNFNALRNPKRDMFWVAAAGPAANFAMALAWALLFKVGMSTPDNLFTTAMLTMATAGVTVNLVLMVLNLLPILPLDGGRIAASLLPNKLAARYARLEPYGFPILLLLLFTNVLGVILGPMVSVSEHVIEGLFQIQL
ncbi:MAG: site-2 protease family protein [Burkholderiales bacterium]|jgi:Zn-dependent protease|nr:site-2 protease family protein [Burkholderiales bacterium]